MLRNICPVIDSIPNEQGDLIAPLLLWSLAHACVLPADHVHAEVLGERVQDDDGRWVPRVEPHRCHCGHWWPVRDVEAVRA